MLFRSTNSAGFLRVSRGSAIVRAIPTKQEILVFTEATLSSLQFTGTSDVFSLQEIGDNLSFIGPRCVTVVNNMTFWMGHDKFYVYSGRVETLPCAVMLPEASTVPVYTPAKRLVFLPKSCVKLPVGVMAMLLCQLSVAALYNQVATAGLPASIPAPLTLALVD